MCCGFNNVTDMAFPADCATITDYKLSCKNLLTDHLASSLSTIGNAGVSVGVIEIVGLVLCIMLFRKILRRESAQASLLNDAWRVNRNKVQYGCQILIGIKTINMSRMIFRRNITCFLASSKGQNIFFCFEHFSK